MGTQQQQTRMALSEIPDRFEDLRLNNSLEHNFVTPQNETNPALIDNRTNVELLSQDPNSSIWSSPDELLIKQRGRRRLTAWSPNEAANSPRSPFQRTPTKLPLTSSMILRSSPRKRLTMGSVPLYDSTTQKDASGPLAASPKKISVRANLMMDGEQPPLAKRSRAGVEDDGLCPFVRSNSEIPLANLLQGYSKQQLIDIIVHELVGDKSNVEEQIRSLLPILRLDEYEQELQHAKRNIYKSLPTSRLCKKTDSIAYARASLHLNEFKRILFLHLKCLHNAALWDTILDYAIMAWRKVAGTPVFDNVVHNAVRRQCFKALLSEAVGAIKQGNTKLGASRIAALEKALRSWSIDYEDSVSCIAVLNKVFSCNGRTSI